MGCTLAAESAHRPAEHVKNVLQNFTRERTPQSVQTRRTHQNDAFIITVSLPHRSVDPQDAASGVDQEAKIGATLAVVAVDAVLDDVVVRSVLIGCFYCHTARLIGVERVQDLRWDSTIIVSCSLTARSIIQGCTKRLAVDLESCKETQFRNYVAELYVATIIQTNLCPETRSHAKKGCQYVPQLASSHPQIVAHYR